MRLLAGGLRFSLGSAPWRTWYWSFYIFLFIRSGCNLDVFCAVRLRVVAAVARQLNGHGGGAVRCAFFCAGVFT